ncbi:hypothetical protein [Mesobacillus selenatarsenatis]|uniref:hypothetical protein n=1 Tax=Mesobacillus selenatarsenatis TaxID=388741 RepID=UPI001435651D|nr:hypothetical protein [Mesobacillus selenatarsenatis]
MKLGKKLTSGPFFVPLFQDGTAVEYLLIGFKNLADEQSTVNLSVQVCRDPFLYPGISPEVAVPITISTGTYTELAVDIPAGSCTVVKVDAGPETFQGNNMLRVTLEGDLDEDGEEVVVALSGVKTGGETVVSMVFKHNDFIELDD